MLNILFLHISAAKTYPFIVKVLRRKQTKHRERQYNACTKRNPPQSQFTVPLLPHHRIWEPRHPNPDPLAPDQYQYYLPRRAS